MYSVKPGRGPALMVVIFWVIGGLSMIPVLIAVSSGGSEALRVIFGVWFVLAAIVALAFALHSAFARKRMTLYDIDTRGEEIDPVAAALRRSPDPPPADAGPASGQDPGASDHRHRGGSCPFCRGRVEPSFHFCPKCGKPI